MENNIKMRLLIASDHAGFSLKEQIKLEFSDIFEFEDFGTFSEESVDYPDYIHPLAYKISENPKQLGIIICGSGNGVCMTANKHPNVRAALCWEREIAELARKHNNANLLSLPARFVSKDLAFKICRSFFTTNFEEGRHLVRVNKINLPK